MERISRWAAKLRHAVTSRTFAAALLAAVTVFMAVTVSVNTHAVTVADGDTSKIVLTMQNDPYKVLESADVTLSENDTLTVDTVSRAIDVNRAMSVEVTADSISTILYMTEGTVADALARAGVTVGGYDTVNTETSAAIYEGISIIVNRVAYEDYTRTESIAYETVTKYTSVLKPGVSKVSQRGVNGVRTLTYRNTIVDGQVVETNQIDSRITTAAVSQIVLKGTTLGTPMSPPPFTVALDEGGQPLHYKKVMSGSCTAYTSDRGDSGAHTSIGMKTQVGIVAVNPAVIPYGTKLYIVSADGKFAYGYAVAGDTGGSVRRGSTLVDLYMNTYGECSAFGRRTLNVYVLE